jgi:hypothetical protein
MYQQNGNRPRIYEPVPMLAHLHVREMHQQADRARLARLACADRQIVLPRVSALVRRIWQALCLVVREKACESITRNRRAPS